MTEIQAIAEAHRLRDEIGRVTYIFNMFSDFINRFPGDAQEPRWQAQVKICEASLAKMQPRLDSLLLEDSVALALDSTDTSWRRLQGIS